MMVITLGPELEAALSEVAHQQGIALEALALKVLCEQFVGLPPHDEWERRLFGAAIDCGASVPHSALSSEGLYE